MSLGKGTRVEWNTSQGKTHGKVVEKKTSDFAAEVMAQAGKAH